MKPKIKKADKQNKGMVDVSDKAVTRRVAVARARIRMSPYAFKELRRGRSPKGNVLETAKVAGILAAKATPKLIPMCHPLELKKVSMSIAVDRPRRELSITAEVVCLGQTGVEMEALTAASVAALTVYDMMKWADRAMVIRELRLVHKSGGKSGTFDFPKS